MTFDDQAVPSSALPPAAASVDADQAAEKRVRRLKGVPKQPGDQVPHDPADQAGRDHGQCHHLGCRRGRSRSWPLQQGEERPDQVEYARERRRRSGGGSAPVAMEVAMALPVSWKPLVKSKARAVMTTSTRIASFPTRIASLPGNLLSSSGKKSQAIVICASGKVHLDVT